MQQFVSLIHFWLLNFSYHVSWQNREKSLFTLNVFQFTNISKVRFYQLHKKKITTSLLLLLFYTHINKTTIIINTNTCPQPLADFIWLNYRARKSGWFAINKRAKQLKLEAKNIWFSKTHYLAIAKNNNMRSVHKKKWKREEYEYQVLLYPQIW